MGFSLMLGAFVLAFIWQNKELKGSPCSVLEKIIYILLILGGYILASGICIKAGFGAFSWLISLGFLIIWGLLSFLAIKYL
jgi:hypothetical protein